MPARSIKAVLAAQAAKAFLCGAACTNPDPHSFNILITVSDDGSMVAAQSSQPTVVVFDMRKVSQAGYIEGRVNRCIIVAQTLSNRFVNDTA